MHKMQWLLGISVLMVAINSVHPDDKSQELSKNDTDLDKYFYLDPRANSLTRFYQDQADRQLPQGSASLAFVFDITGSMYDDLVQVIEGAAKILATTLARREKPLYNYVLVPFHDPGRHCMLIT